MGNAGLTGVIDLGKSHGRLVLIDRLGATLDEHCWDSGSIESPAGYLALDTDGTASQLTQALAGIGSAAASALRRLIVVGHGAAVAALGDDALALPVPDYEWTGFDDAACRPAGADFDRTLSPLLSRGLNLGVQLAWWQQHQPQAMARVRQFLPLAQYWGWWLSGVAASEQSSLGCHTLLWQPREATFSAWAQAQGWHRRFAPMRRAWEVLGPLRPALARQLGLPADVLVHVGAHDSNACLARYLHSWPRLTLVSTGTWVVVMAAGAPERPLDAAQDQLGNVSVRGDLVPTGRFMGGRELSVLCAGADPALADPDRLAGLLARGLQMLPGFAGQGGPFASTEGRLRLGDRSLGWNEWSVRFDVADRATAASLYAGQMTALTIARLGAAGPVVVEGPFAHNPVVLAVLAALLPGIELHVSADAAEGTVRGGWCLTRWTDAQPWPPEVRRIAEPASMAPLLRAHHGRWLAALGEPG
ncbi:MAG: hypothetical protein HY021_10505 [Burkholderiales bacterium]|nr:hypothetical protein [Burkholderiales bacterium]